MEGDLKKAIEELKNESSLTKKEKRKAKALLILILLFLMIVAPAILLIYTFSGDAQVDEGPYIMTQTDNTLIKQLDQCRTALCIIPADRITQFSHSKAKVFMKNETEAFYTITDMTGYELVEYEDYFFKELFYDPYLNRKLLQLKIYKTGEYFLTIRENVTKERYSVFVKVYN